MKESKMNKPTIIAICGKSSSGKDSTARELCSLLSSVGYNAGGLVSDTSRPPRDCEKKGVDYNFISCYNFINKIKDNKYLEWSKFRGWYYGTPATAIKYDINIGVFNPEGIVNLLKYKNDYDIYVVILENKTLERLKRSVRRENKFKLEYLRRLFTDWKDFKHFNSLGIDVDLVIKEGSIKERCIKIIEILGTK
jgi:guanylate kinase